MSRPGIGDARPSGRTSAVFATTSGKAPRRGFAAGTSSHAGRSSRRPTPAVVAGQLSRRSSRPRARRQVGLRARAGARRGRHR